MEAALHPACAVHQQVDAALDRAPQREDRLIGRLRIERVRGADVRRPVWQSVAPSKLATDHRGPHVFRGPERGSARLHVDVRGEAAVDDRRARVDRLGQHHRGERLGVLLRERAGERHRPPRPRQREGRDADDLVVAGELHDPLEHRRVEPERRARVHDREHRRLTVDRRLVDAAGDPDHLEDVDVALAAEAVAVDRLVHQRQRVEGRPEVTDAVMEVDGLHGVARQEMDRVEHLREPQQVLVVGTVADPAAPIEIGDVGRAPDRAECDPVATEPDVVRRIPGVEREAGRRRPDPLLDHLWLEADAGGVRLCVRARIAEDLSRVWVEEIHPDLGEDAERRDVDRLELVLGDDGRRTVAHARLSPRTLLGQGAPLMPRPTAAAATWRRLVRPNGFPARHLASPLGLRGRARCRARPETAGGSQRVGGRAPARAPRARKRDTGSVCGIAGVWGSADSDVVERMMAGIAHRGPDGSGIHCQPEGALGHRRLAIMDPAGGAQPLYDETGARAIVANGEIYNFPDLRADLAGRHTFSTMSDIEAVLHLFEERGAATPAGLGGMFAFAIADGDHLFLARDPLGIKPLYHGRGRDGTGRPVTVFASEMKALADWVDELDEFPPGTWYDSRVGFKRYYKVPDGPPVERSVEDHVAAVREGLERAVASHLMSDVPVGAFLSGGLDSSVLAAIARRHVDELHTFSVGIAGSRDLAAARRVADHIGSVHHEHVITDDEVVAALPDIVAALESFDQDLVRSAIPTYFCARLAAEHVKVILTGEGADELFAGYRYHADIPDPATLHRELIRSVGALHDVNLQRVDRLTMRHGLEGRVPFLDTAFIELALSVPVELKLRRDVGGPPTEKWILRKATEDLLPADIVWRRKEQFDEGSGTVDLLAAILGPLVADVDVAAESAVAGQPLRSAEEAYYHRLLRESAPRPELVLANVGRWASGRTAQTAAPAAR